MLKEYIIKATTDGSGDSVDLSEMPVFGRVYAVDLIDGDLADGVDTTFTYVNSQGVTKTLLTLTDWNSDKTLYPREVMHGNTGSALTGTAGGDTTMPIVAGYVTATTAQGGATKSGSYLLYILD